MRLRETKRTTERTKERADTRRRHRNASVAYRVICLHRICFQRDDNNADDALACRVVTTRADTPHLASPHNTTPTVVAVLLTRLKTCFELWQRDIKVMHDTNNTTQQSKRTPSAAQSDPRLQCSLRSVSLTTLPRLTRSGALRAIAHN